MSDFIDAEEQAELDALSSLPDDVLWTTAREKMQPDIQERLSFLMDKNSDGTITPDEYAELSQLVEHGERLLLRKSTAMKYLFERGYKITLDHLKTIG